MKKFLVHFEENLCVIMLPIMTILVVLSVFGRYTGLFLLNWAEETVRYMYIWLAFLGVGAAAKTDSHFRVGALVESLKPKAKVVASYIYNGLTLAFLVALIVISFNLLERLASMNQLTPMLRLPMGVAYGAIPVGCILMILRTVQRLYEEYKERKSGKTDVAEKEADAT